MRFALPLLLCLYAAAQTPAFEVVSVKPLTLEQQTREGIGLFTYPGGRIRATNYTLRLLIHDAYAMELHQVVGGPAWLDTDAYVVEAKPPASAASASWIPDSPKTPPTAEMREMLRVLLADRFDLKAHRESRSASVFVLTVAKGGPKLQPPKDPFAEPHVGSGRTGPDSAEAQSQTFFGQNATMDQLAARLAQNLRRPVVNRTGLDGHFDFLIEYSATDSQNDKASPLVREIQDQAGLKLETQPGAIEVLVVESARKPAPN